MQKFAIQLDTFLALNALTGNTRIEITDFLNEVGVNMVDVVDFLVGSGYRIEEEVTINGDYVDTKTFIVIA